jgi:hypothetical protein
MIAGNVSERRIVVAAARDHKGTALGEAAPGGRSAVPL